MFADALLDSHHQSRRGWATLTSFSLQAILLACLLILPLFYTQVLPHIDSVAHIVTPHLQPEPAPNVAPTANPGGASSIYVVAHPEGLITPYNVPHGISASTDVAAPQVFFDPVGDRGPGSPEGVWHGLDNATPVMPQHETAPKALRISRMMEGSLTHRVEPEYPVLAKAARVQGTVVLAAVIGRDGSVTNLQAVSGHPLLVRAALNAVSQWRYRPYLLNDTPVEVETQVTVNFILGR